MLQSASSKKLSNFSSSSSVRLARAHSLITNREIDTYHAKITELYFNTADPQKCQEYNDLSFIVHVRTRALEAIRELLVKVNSDALKTEDTQRDFDLYSEFMRITMNSKRNEKGVYDKARGEGKELGLNILEYAIITGGMALVTTFVSLGVISENLQKLVDNLTLIQQSISNEESKTMLNALLTAVSKSESESLHVVDVKRNDRLTILFKNRKLALLVQTSLFIIGVGLIAIAASILAGDTVWYAALLAIGGGCIINSFTNTSNMFMNTVREDNLNRMKLHKDSLDNIAEFVSNLGITLDGLLYTTKLANDGKTMTFSEASVPTTTIQPIAKSSSNPKLKPQILFSVSNNRGLGLNTNSDTNSDRNIDINNAKELRKFENFDVTMI
jgi:hypothetical protein